LIPDFWIKGVFLGLNMMNMMKNSDERMKKMNSLEILGFLVSVGERGM
jgi:hypothetical protein